MEQCECLDVGADLIESVGLLHSISMALLTQEFDPLVWELQALEFNHNLAWVVSLWERLKIIMHEIHEPEIFPLDAVSRTLAEIHPILV